MRLPPVGENSDRVIGIDTLRRNGTPLRVLVQRQDRQFETIEPAGALLRRPFDDP